MNCTRCLKPILPGEKHYRTKKGRHHVVCPDPKPGRPPEGYVMNQPTDIREITNIVYKVAADHGWHSQDGDTAEVINRYCNNLHNEVSELHEAWREGRLLSPCDKADKMEELGLEPLNCLEEELADIVIRALDNAKALGVDIVPAIYIKNEYNKSRKFRHGGKQS